MTTASRRLPWEGALLSITLAGLGAGAVGYLAGAQRLATVAWAVTTVVGILAAGWWVVEGLRDGRLGVDVIALLALSGALAVHEELAGAVIAVMLATGRALEAWAAGRARHELRALAERAPRQAHRHGIEGLETVP